MRGSDIIRAAAEKAEYLCHVAAKKAEYRCSDRRQTVEVIDVTHRIIEDNDTDDPIEININVKNCNI